MRAYAAFWAALVILGAWLLIGHLRGHHAVTAAPGTWITGGATCVFQAAGTDTQARVTGVAGCGEVHQTLVQADGLGWTQAAALTGTGADGQPEFTVCSLHVTHDTSLTVTVLDAGAAVYGASLCTSADNNGWTP